MWQPNRNFSENVGSQINFDEVYWWKFDWSFAQRNGSVCILQVHEQRQNRPESAFQNQQLWQGWGMLDTYKVAPLLFASYLLVYNWLIPVDKGATSYEDLLFRSFSFRELFKKWLRDFCLTIHPQGNNSAHMWVCDIVPIIVSIFVCYLIIFCCLLSRLLWLCMNVLIFILTYLH